MVRSGHVPLTSLSFSIASSTTYSDERCSSVFSHSRACEFHLQLFGRQRGIAFHSSPVLAHAVPVSANEKVVTPLVFFTLKIQSNLHLNGHLSTTATFLSFFFFFFVAANIPYTFFFCLNLYTTATSNKACPNCQNKTFRQRPVFHKQLIKKSRMVMKFDPYGALMINRGNCILIHRKHASGSIYTAAANINCLRCL